MTRNDNPNRQRDHQANERTFLAWLRTSVSLIAFGFAIARFGLFSRQLESALTNQPLPTHPTFNSENLGVMLVVFGIASMPIAAYRYSKVHRQIERGDFRPDRLIVWVMTTAVMVMGILSIPLLTGQRSSSSSSPSLLQKFRK